MSVILDALKRVQDESRHRTHSESPSPDGWGQNPDAMNSDAMLRRLGSDSGRGRRPSLKDVSPAVWTLISAFLVVALVVFAVYWIVPQLQPAPPTAGQGQEPLLAELLGGQPAGSTPPPAGNDPGAAVGAVPHTPYAAGSVPPGAPAGDPGGTQSDGPDLSDLSGRLASVGAGAASGNDASRSGAATPDDGTPVLELSTNEAPPAPRQPARQPDRQSANQSSSLDVSSGSSQTPAVTSRVPTTPEYEMPGMDGRPMPSSTSPQRLLDPSVRDAFLDGVRLHKNGAYADAENAYLRALKLDPQNARVNANLGVLYESLGELTLAEQHLRTSLAVEQNQASAHNNLGVVLYRRGNYDGALVEFKRTLSLDPQMMDAYTNMGLIYTRWGDYRKAENAFLQALSINSQHALSYYNLGLVYEEQGQIEKALENYEYFLGLGGSDHPEVAEYLIPHLQWLETRARNGVGGLQ